MTFKVFCDRLDCKVTAQEVPLDHGFIGISRAMFYIRWVTNAAQFAKFGDDAALTNGINFKYKGSTMFSDNIKDMSDIIGLAHDYIIDSDGAGTTVYHFSSRLTFEKFSPNNEALPIDAVTDFVVDINDDLSGSANTEIHVTIEGY